MNEKGLLAGDCCSCPVPPPRRAQDWEEGGGRVSSANKDAFLCWAFQLSALSLVFRRVCLGLKGPRRSKSLAKPAPSPPVSAQRPAGQEAAVSRRWRSGTAQPLSPTAVRRPGLGDKFQGVCSDFLGDFSIRSITFSSRQKSIPVPEVVEGARTRALRISRGPRAPGAWARAGNQYAWGGRCAWLGGGPVRGRLNETFGRGWQGMAGEKDRDLFCQGRGPLVCCWFLGCTPFPAPRPPAPVPPLRRRPRSLPERPAPLCRARGAPGEVSLKAWQPKRRAFLPVLLFPNQPLRSRSPGVRQPGRSWAPVLARPKLGSSGHKVLPLLPDCRLAPGSQSRAQGPSLGEPKSMIGLSGHPPLPLKGANRVLVGPGVGIASSETGDPDWGQKPLAAVPLSPRSAEGSAEATAPGMG